MSSPAPYFAGLRFLHAPGPTHVPKAVMDAMSDQPLDPADERLEPMIAECETGLKWLLGTRDSHAFLYATNGHGAWEAVTVNLAAPGQTVLVPSTGHFSDSWVELAQALGVKVVRTPYREGYPIDPADVEAALTADRDKLIAAVFVVHTDTASSVTNDLPAIRAAMNRSGHPALLVADVVASLGAAPFRMDEWGVNVVMGASQKGLMCPPGVGFCAADDKAIAVAQACPSQRYYWDWLRRMDAPLYRKFCGTAPQNLLMGLHASLGLIKKEGLDAVHARHRRFASAVQAAVTRWSEGGAVGFICEVPDARSVSVTTVSVKGHNPEEIRRVARQQYNVAVAGGLGPFTGRVFRIGHLGDLSAPMVLGALAGVEASMRALQVPIGEGALAAAVAAMGR